MKKWALIRKYIATGVLSAALLAGGSAAFAADSPDADSPDAIETVEAERDRELKEDETHDFSEDAEIIASEGDDAADQGDEDIIFKENETDFEDSEFFEEDAEVLLEEGEEESEAEELSGEAPTSGELKDSMSWKLESGVLIISGSGDMPDYAGPDETPWHESLSLIEKVVAEENITSIGSFAFASASILTEADLPSTLKKIGDSAFASCQALSSVSVPSGTQTIGEKAFANCAKLADVSIPDSVTSIGGSAFEGSSQVVIKGNFGQFAEKYAKEKGIPFAPLTQTSISSGSVTLSQTVYNYTGGACTPAVNVVMSVTPLKKDTDFTVSYKNNVNAGTATVTVTGKGNYKDSASKTFTINSISLASASVSGISNKTYTGSPVTQSPTVTLSGRTLVSGKDYALNYSNNVKVGTATVTIAGKGNYSGSIQKNFKIDKASLSTASVTNVENKTYNGKAQKQKPVVTVAGRKLKQGADYTVSYKNNVKIGTATMILKGKGSYKGTIKKKFKIKKASVADAVVTGISDRQYTGQPITQDLKVKVGKKTLRKGDDYSVSYSNNVNVGTATLTIKGKGNYKGKNTKSFRINKADIENASIQNVVDKPYTGKAQKQDPVITQSGRTLKRGVDYTLSYENNIAIGTAVMIVTGKGNYTGRRRVSFRIRLIPIKDARVSGIQDKEYTGSEVTQSITVSINGNTLKSGKDYTVSYKNNVSVGRAYIQITGNGSYTGTLTAGFNILPRRTTVTSASLVGTRMTVRWVSRGGIVDGYQIQYSTDRSFSDSGSITTLRVQGGDSSSTAFSLTAGKRYYVRIRTYKVSDGGTYYSYWSPAV